MNDNGKAFEHQPIPVNPVQETCILREFDFLDPYPGADRNGQDTLNADHSEWTVDYSDVAF